MVVVTDTDEGVYALSTAIREARESQAPLIVLNLTSRSVDVSSVGPGVSTRTITRNDPADRDHATVILEEVGKAPDVTKLVLGVRRRSPVGKATLGNVGQRVLLEAPVPVLAVKVPE
ncbi:universal stress protein [Hoyosella sp. YIM 151337]|uniref:universal stress protein n=1 Tax=Hoyosella sp. YIM 151337 TaxID=2992742 RepID=UPI00223668A7|nr:universal stress protein [Hoyosella sp. YIM 151337]MCW4354284.1 universal stress protein [Hoyosella sp. YIM 151337]